MKKFLLLLLLITPLFCAEPLIRGFFVQPSLEYGVASSNHLNTQKQYDSWVSSMAELGSRHLFLQWSVHYEENQHWFSDAYGGDASADFALYPTSGEKLNGITSRSWGEGDPLSDSTLSFILNSCKKNGVSLWIGLYLNESDNSFNWWKAVNDQEFTSADSSIIEHHVERSLSTINELSLLYRDHPAFEGIYLSFEVANYAFLPEENQTYLISILNRITNSIRTKLPGKRAALSPFFNHRLSTPEEFGDMWERILTGTDIDLFILQDGVGVEPKSLTFFTDKVSPYFKAAQRAANRSETTFWINCEIFSNLQSRENPHFTSGKINTIKRQLKRASQYCDTIISFDFSYIDPNGDQRKQLREEREKLYKSYRRYFRKNR